MTLTTWATPSLHNGVSQQPAPVRLPSQSEDATNCVFDLASGVRKRSPARHVARLSETPLDSAHIHEINRDVSERYVVVVTDGTIRVFDSLTGAERTVSFPVNSDYLSLPEGVEPADAFALVSVADYTFVVNKTVTVSLDAAGADATVPPAFPDYYLPRGWHPYPDANFTNTAGTLRGVKQTFTDLPTEDDDVPPVEGDLWKIAGYDQDSFGAYYVVRRGDVWEETVAPGLVNRFDDATMPHALVREADGTFAFRPFKWNVRQMGDDESNPAPTFVGNRIVDVFFYKNRLGFVSEENVIFSGAGDFGNFWRTTVTDLLDSDLVDVAVSSNQVSLLQYAVPFNNNLMLFADQTQFSLNVDQLLTPSSVSIDTVTAFEMNTAARPVGIGNDIYFATETGRHSRIREYFVQEGSENSTDAADITAHIPRYIPKGLTKLIGSSNDDTLFALSAGSPELSVYQFHWEGDQKAQSAWSRWAHASSAARILSGQVLDSELYLVVSYSDGTYLERIDLQDGRITGGLDFEVLLDRLCEPTAELSDDAQHTTLSLPYPVAEADRPNFRLILGTGLIGRQGALLSPSTYEWVNASTVRVPGSAAVGGVYGGLNYKARLDLSEQFLRRRDTAITTGRLQLRTMTVYFTDTSFFRLVVDPYGTGSPRHAEFTGKIIGSPSFVTGRPVFESGDFTATLAAHSKDVRIAFENDTHVQFHLQSIEWEALYHNRARA
ncbi:MAG: hypothetical protein AAF628_08360 [Planctomycetota bacterium]